METDINTENKETTDPTQTSIKKDDGYRMMKLVVKLFKKNMNKTILLEQILNLITMFIPICFTFLYGRAIDSISKTNETTDFYCIIYISILIGERIIEKSKKILFPDYVKQGNDMKLEFFKSIISKDIAFFDKFTPGDILAKFQEDFNNFYYFRPATILSNINDAINFIFVIFYMINTSLNLLLIYGSIFLFDFYNFKSKKYEDHWTKYSRMSTELFKYQTEIIMNIRLVKSFSTEEKEIAKLQKKFEEFHNFYITNFTSSSWNDRYFYEKIIDILGIWYAGSQILQGNLTIGGFTAFQLIFKETTYIVPKILNSYKEMIEKVVKIEKILELMEHDIGVKNIENPIINENMKAAIEFKNLSFAYPNKQSITIIKNLSLRINQGETVALVGASGCGKSTISALVQRFYDPQEGEILIDDTNLKNYKVEWLHSKIGYVSQEPILFADTIENNIAYALDKYTQEDLDKAAKLSHCYEFITNKDKFPEGYKTMLGDKGLTLSGGQKQRVAIARALIKNVKILIFDEATSSLDSESESEVQKAIDQIIENGCITTIIIAHRLSTVKNCKKIFVMKNGEVAEVGSHSQLLKKNGVYKTLINKQLESALQKTASNNSIC